MVSVVIGKPTDPTATQLIAIGVDEVQRFVPLMNRGRYQWVRRDYDFVCGPCQTNQKVVRLPRDLPIDAFSV